MWNTFPLFGSALLLCIMLSGVYRLGPAPSNASES